MLGCSAITSFGGLAGDGTVDAATAPGDASFADGGAQMESGVDSGQDAGRPPPTSCHDGGAGVGPTCGATKADDCCAISPVPGGTYNRSNQSAYPATVSPFLLDKQEVTVGRFRRFVNANLGTQAAPPISGVGAHPKIASSGWDSSWNAKLAASPAALLTTLHCGNSHWTDAVDAYESYPMGCITFYVGFAFCAWDGGRLPTEAEWNYAAAGGSEQRKYAWSSPPGSAAIDDTYATYGCFGHGGTPTHNEAGSPNCVATDILAVGVHSPKGDGKWGHADLGGSMWEWTLDVYASPYPQADCVDCANLKVSSASERVIRGGDYDSDPYMLDTAYRSSDLPTTYQDDRGLRCARDP